VFGETKFTDLTDAEFESSYLTKLNHEVRENLIDYSNFRKSIPKSLNWVERGAVTEVKDQGACGSCWSFSTTGVLEGWFFRQTGELVSLSEKMLIDCTSVK
jgi:cathepsin L